MWYRLIDEYGNEREFRSILEAERAARRDFDPKGEGWEIWQVDDEGTGVIRVRHCEARHSDPRARQGLGQYDPGSDFPS